MSDIDDFGWPDNGSPHPDAELLRLGYEFSRVRAAWLPIYADMWKLHSRSLEEWEKRGLSIDENFAAFCQLREEMGVEAAIEANDKELERVDAAAAKIRETPAQ